jgi:hypothetical protein
MSSDNEYRGILEEHAVPERHGLLGGRSLTTLPDGKLEKLNFVQTCDFCGSYPLEEYVICRACRGKLCDDCAVKLDGIPYCRTDLIRLIPVTHSTFKTLLCLESGIQTVHEISDITRIPKGEIKASIALLLELKLIESKGLLAFMERKVTADGLRAISVYSKVYGSDEDVQDVRQKIEEEQDGN